MKKLMVYAALFAITACSSSDEKTKKEDLPQQALAKGNNTDLFNRSFSKLMSDYYRLKDNFIAENDTAIISSAKNVMKDADSLKLGDLKADTSVVATAKASAQNISGEIKGLLGEKDIELKRKSFYTLSEQLYDLVRIVQYDKEMIYHQHCPMAFNDAGANWLSNSSEIRNPYIPRKMLTCGEVMDSLDFRHK